MLNIQDFAPINIDTFLMRAQNEPVRRMGEFENILKKEMEKKNPRLYSQNRVVQEDSDNKLLDLSYEMESIFIGQMLRTMRNTVMETDFFGKSMAKDIFNDMLYDEYAKLMARTDQFGLARQIYNQLNV
jgi:flagellar protein FlgJ